MLSVRDLDEARFKIALNQLVHSLVLMTSGMTHSALTDVKDLQMPFLQYPDGASCNHAA